MPLDIGFGILFSLFIAHAFGVHASVWTIFTGVVFSLLPDIDILPIFWPNKYDHRSWMHWPIIWIIPIALWFFVFGPMWGALLLLCIVAHFIHDTIGIGWGVAWLAPFSKRKFLFPNATRRVKHGFFMTWLPEAEERMAGEYHDPHWVRTFYFRPNPVAYIEYGALLVAVAALCLYFWHGL